MTRIVGMAEGFDLIVWENGVLEGVLPLDRAEQIVDRLARPVRVPRSGLLMRKGVPVGVEDRVELLQPGSDEHAAYVILSLPGGTLLEGDDVIAEEDDDDAVT